MVSLENKNCLTDLFEKIGNEYKIIFYVIVIKHKKRCLKCFVTNDHDVLNNINVLEISVMHAVPFA